jgi:DNA polymerase III delta subunit
MAVPNPAQELKRLDTLVRAGLPPIVLVHGESEFFRSKAMERLLSAVPKDAELRTVDGAEVRAGDEGDDGEDGGTTSVTVPVLQDLRGGGLFASATIVAVRRAANWWKKHGAAVAEVAPKIQQGSSLLVEAPKLDKRKKAAATLFKQLAGDGAVFEFRELYDMPYDRARGPLEGELCKWVGQAGKKLGVPLTPESAWLVISQVGKSPSELLGELERLRDQLGSDPVRGALAPKDLAGKLSVSFESTPFEFAEAVLGGDRRTAQRSLAAMFQRGVKQKDGKSMDSGGVLPFTSSWLYRQISVVYEGRILFDAGTSMRDIPSRCGVRQFADRFLEQVKQNDQAQLQRGILALHAALRKSRLTGEDGEALLERFLAQWFDGVPIETAEELEL